ncbi:cytochrome b [Bowmanella yangjiangensis]|uniref:Cytochrome b n=1 Tax=Bowmanella yangjiangensis TaxID=2811230 RepID=A0ABS3CUW0_9ALTE|nr:cytochrome b [Bowmanella yangjiangensis]MBN7820911.1 cytochrome b [Bowmanella yangjiangensis]
MRNSETSWGWTSIVLHWLSALAVIGLFALGWWMVDLDYYSEWYREAPHLHKSIGILLALTTLLRLLWRFKKPRPETLGKPWEVNLSHFTHVLMYILLLAIFTSGYLISTADSRGIDVFNWFTVPGLGEWIENQEDLAGEVHEWLAWSLIGLVVLHALAAIKHHVIDKDNTLTRMLKP